MRRPKVSEPAAIGIRRRGIEPDVGRDVVRAEVARTAAGPTLEGAPACSAWANWSSEANRSAATGASARRIASSSAAGIFGRTERILGAGSLSRLAAIAWAVAPFQGGSPASIS